MSCLTAAVELLWPSITKVRSVINLLVKHLGWGICSSADCALWLDLSSKSLEAPYQIISSHDNHLRREVANISSGGRAGVWVSWVHSLLRTRPTESSQSAATTQRIILMGLSQLCLHYINLLFRTNQRAVKMSVLFITKSFNIKENRIEYVDSHKALFS